MLAQLLFSLLVGARLFLGVRAAPVVAVASGHIALSSIDFIFAFGGSSSAAAASRAYTHSNGHTDSYTASGYNPAAGINNLSYYGNTSSNGLTWLQYLALENPSSENSFYNFAQFGATTNNSILASRVDNVTVPDFVSQVATFQDYFVPAPAVAPWTPANTLFAIWMGINDVGGAFVGNRSFMDIQGPLLTSYSNMVTTLYAAGARNFLILGVPPTYRTPLIQDFGPAAVQEVTTNAGLFNFMLSRYVALFPQIYPGSTTSLFDTVPFFDAIIDNPYEYGFTDSKDVCPDYVNVRDDPLVNLNTCPWPFSQYVWANEYHPTWKVHELLAKVIAQTLQDETNVTATAIPTARPTETVAQTTITSSRPTSAVSTVLPSVLPSSTPTSSASRNGGGGFAGSVLLLVAGLLAVS